MKAPVLFIIIFVSCFGAANAQSSGFFVDEPKVFAGGISVGGNACTVDGDGFGGYHKAGLNAGAVVYTRFSNRFYASLELLYTQKGSRGANVTESPYVGTFIERYWLDLNYVEAPLIIHYGLSRKWHIGLGASYARLIKSREDALSDQPVYIDPALHPFRKTDIQYILSGTIQFGSNFFLNGRYQYSMTTIRDWDKIPVNYGGGAQFNNLFALKIIYLMK